MCVCVSVGPSVVYLYVRSSVCVSFQDDNLSKRQWILTKLGMYIDIVTIWFEIANGSSSFDGVNLPETCPYFCFRMITCVNVKRC